MPTLRNARHERFAQGLAKGLSAEAAYAAAGYKPDRGHASRLAAKGIVRRRVDELMRLAAQQTVKTGANVIEELWDNVRLAKTPVPDGKGKAQDLSAANRALELLGRFYRTWSPEDAADATADHVPLAERLKAYAREAEVKKAENVVPIRPRAG